MAAEWLKIVSLAIGVAVAARITFGVLLPSLATVEWQAVVGWARRGGQKTAPHGRSIEQIARDLRRLGPKVHQPPPGTSRTKIVAARCAYDRVLGEAATAMDVDHLLAVLPPGEDLDAERSRVENRLWVAGLRFEEAA